jgi:predicted Zn-dependent protease
MEIVLRTILAPVARPEDAAGAAPFLVARNALLVLHPVANEPMRCAVAILESGRVDEAKRAALRYLEGYPGDAGALNLLADVAGRSGHDEEAEQHLAECLRRHPDHDVYRYNYALLLLKREKTDEALAEADTLLRRNPSCILFRAFRTIVLERSMRYEDAICCYRELTADFPASSELWLGLARALRCLGGHGDECTAAYRKAIALCPSTGNNWWNLASLKTVRFTEDDVQLMEDQLARPAVSSKDRADMHFALGTAYGDIGNYGKSFQHYTRGNSIRRQDAHYDAEEITAMVSRAKAVFTQEFFEQFAGAGAPSAEPIFILGMQRAGSTLLEQILDCHSAIEGAGELRCVPRIVSEDVVPRCGPNYLREIDLLDPSDLRSMGDKYVALASGLRSTAKPLFVDKHPFNLWHLGLIHLMLPNAKIIDIRRHPIACSFANFTMNFAHAPPVSYSLSDIGRYYADYVRLMDHFDCVLPGRICRVFYERLVTDCEAEVRRILEFLGLPFESRCLEYYKSGRALNSYSNEQVRRPLFTDGLEHWRNYEPWLDPLKAALGPVLDAYPGVPDFT